jgi:hypothetical protein
MRLRFSFKALLAVFTVLAICLGMFAIRLHDSNRQRDVVAALRAADASVWYGYETFRGTPLLNSPDPLATGPQEDTSGASRWRVWLGRRFGRDFAFDVNYICAFQPLSADLILRVADLRALDHLQLDVRRPFGDDAWRAILQCRQIAKLTIKRDQVGDARALVGLSALDQLECLTVDGGEITADDAREIAKLQNLRELTLSLVTVTDDSLQPLGELRNLERLLLKHRGTGPNNAAAGVAALTRLPKLRELELGRLVTLDDSVFSLLATMTQLESLNLEQAGVTGSEIELLSRLPKLKELSLVGTKVDDTAMEKLAKMTQLDSLDISYTKVTDAGLKHVGSLPNLRILGASGNPITDAGLAEIGRLSQLAVLMMANADISDAGLEHIAGLPKLIGVSLSGNPKVSKASVAKLKAALPNRNVYD